MVRLLGSAPATILLALIAYKSRRQPKGISSPHTWIVQGALSGIVAAVSYDLFRLPFVLNGAPLFNVFPQFGRLLLGKNDPQWLVQLVGWSYHFSNGAALGIMFLALVPKANPRILFWGAVAWALFVEGALLMTPYAKFFGLKLDARFIFLTVSAHLIFGIVLGVLLRFHFSKISRGDHICIS